MFRYDFMIIAFVAALLLGIVFPLLGGTVVYKKLSSSGDALAHSSLAGIAIGLVSGLNPLYISIATCVISFLIIGVLRKKFGKHAEIGVVVVLSAASAVSGILSGYAGASNFDSYLFGSILLLGETELIVVIVLTVVAVAFFLVTYYRQFHALYSEQEAKIGGIRVELLDLIHSLLFALTVAIGAKVVGSLVVSSMVVLPTAAALLLRRGYKVTTAWSVAFSVVAMIGGIVCSYYLEWKPGATSVGIAVILLLSILSTRTVIGLIRGRKRKERP